MADVLCVCELLSLRRSLHDDACTGTSVATSVTSRCVCVFAGARQHHAAGSATPGRTLVLAACAHAAHDVERRRRLMTSRRSRARSLARTCSVRRCVPRLPDSVSSVARLGLSVGTVCTEANTTHVEAVAICPVFVIFEVFPRQVIQCSQCHGAARASLLPLYSSFHARARACVCVCT